MKFFKWMGNGLKKTGNAISNFFKGVVKEGKRVRWPSKNDMMENTVTVVVFSAFFAFFFAAAFTIAEAILKGLGYL